LCFFFRRPRLPPKSTLFPYTTLFRSRERGKRRESRMTMQTCPTCEGRRTIETTVPNVKKYGGVEYVSSIQPTKIRLDVCSACNGAGKVDDLIATWERVAAQQLAFSDRAAKV